MLPVQCVLIAPFSRYLATLCIINLVREEGSVVSALRNRPPCDHRVGFNEVVNEVCVFSSCDVHNSI